MEHKETNKGLIPASILLYNEDYFTYVFKKTERIVSAVFYTTRSVSDTATKDTVITFIEDKAQALLLSAEKTLRAPESSRRLRLEELHIALIGLESALAVGSSARVIPTHAFEVFRNELTSVHKALKEYHREDTASPLSQIASREDTERQKRRPAVPRLRTTSGTISPDETNGTLSRSERILAIIKDKGQASIKDVSSVIAEYSEKTIQRELMSLISQGLIVKEGERRWSRYSIAGQ